MASGIKARATTRPESRSAFGFVVHPAIVKRAARGDAKAHEIIYRAFATPVYSICLRFTRVPAHAEDLVQETFIEIMRSIARVSPQRGSPGCLIEKVWNGPRPSRSSSPRDTPTIAEESRPPLSIDPGGEADRSRHCTDRRKRKRNSST